MHPCVMNSRPPILSIQQILVLFEYILPDLMIICILRNFLKEYAPDGTPIFSDDT